MSLYDDIDEGASGTKRVVRKCIIIINIRCEWSFRLCVGYSCQKH